MRVLMSGVTLVAALALVAWLIARPAHGHDAPSVWSYGFECCSGIDCREIPDGTVGEMAAGYVAPSGETIGCRDARLRRSGDEHFHWCTEGGRADGATICLYVPNRGF